MARTKCSRLVFGALVVVAVMLAVAVAVVEVIYMVAVLDCLVAAIWAVDVSVVFMGGAGHC